MPRTKKPELRFPIKLTWAQRKILADAAPGLGNRFEKGRTKPADHRAYRGRLKAVKARTEAAILKASTGYEELLEWVGADLILNASIRRRPRAMNKGQPDWRNMPGC